MTAPLTDERRAALSSLITNWFSTLDADGGLIREFDYFDVSKIDELIDQAIAPAIADAVECARAASSAAVAELPSFPTMLRKMWSGGDVQRWIDDNIKPIVQERHFEAHCAPAAPVADMSDAYVGAREDLAIWKRRAFEAEGKVEQLADARKLVAHASEFAMMQLDEDWHARAAALLALPAPAVSASAPPAHIDGATHKHPR